MCAESLQELREMFGYYHQDWGLDHATPDEVLEFYMSQESEHDLTSTARQLGELLSEPYDNCELERILLKDLSCEYLPTKDGWDTVRDWLEHVLVKLTERARRP